MRLISESDPEALHDFRVALRKLRVFVAVLSPLDSVGALKRMAIQLKKWMDQTSSLRDQEVIVAILAKYGVSSFPVAATSKDAHCVEDLIAQIRRPSFDRWMTKLEKALRQTIELHRDRKDLRQSLEESVRGEQRKLRKALREYFKDLSRLEKLHRVRIRSKKLRYAVELIQEKGHSDETPVLKVARNLQEVVGDLRDLDLTLQVISPIKSLPPWKEVYASLTQARSQKLMKSLAAVSKLGVLIS